MKNLSLILALIITQIGLGQTTEADNKIMLKAVSIGVEVDALDELQALDWDELISVYDLSKDDQPIELKIICKFNHETDGVLISDTQFTVKGNSSDLDSFLDQTAKLKTAISKFYNTKR